jgi:hypothetical protein
MTQTSPRKNERTRLFGSFCSAQKEHIALIRDNYTGLDYAKSHVQDTLLIYSGGNFVPQGLTNAQHTDVCEQFGWFRQYKTHHQDTLFVVLWRKFCAAGV